MNPVFVELFSGTGKMAKAFKKMGWDVITIDNDPKHNPTICMDILDITPLFLANLNPTVIWAGVDCSCFTVLTMSHYWNKDGTPNEKNYGIPLLRHTVHLIASVQPAFWAIENPRAMMRKQQEVQSWARYEICQCQYGLDFMKPTDLFGYLPPSFYPRMCKRKGVGRDPECDHKESPAGSQNKGLQGSKLTRTERAQYPEALCEEIARHCDDAIKSGNINGWFLCR